jgi:uncharacterized metal-binding protein YceD (DUF177 family)
MSRSYLITLNGFEEGHHSYDLEITREFFDLFEESEIREGELVAVIDLEKCSSNIDLTIRISGKVKVCCDRCLEMFDHPVECENRLLVRVGKVFDDSDPEVITVPSSEHELDIKQYLYEFILLALPIQRLHPDDDDGRSTCNPVMLQKLGEYLVEGENDKYDSRWDELKKLMDNN